MSQQRSQHCGRETRVGVHERQGAEHMQFPFTEPPAFGATIEVKPGIHWLRMPLPLALDHINLYLVDGGDGWYIIDTGLRGGEVQRLWEQVFAQCLGGRPVLGIVVTHMHPDHVGQAGWLSERWQAPLYMTQGEYYTGRTFAAGPGDSVSFMIRQFYQRAGMPPQSFEQIRARASGFSRVVEPMPGAFIRIVEGDELCLGDTRWQVVVGQGHSPEHACLLDPERGVLFSGDQIIATISSNVSVLAIEPEANPLKLWLASHDKMLGLDALDEDTLVLPAHGLPFRGARTRLRQLIAHHEGHLQALESACREPRNPMELLPVLFKRELGAEQINLAIGECIAHLHYLMARGQLERLLIDDVYHFRSCDPVGA